MGQVSKIDEFGLDNQQRRFVEEYLVCLDKTKAATAAGYDAAMANALITHPLIEIAISELSQRHLKRLQMSQEEAIGTIAKIARTTIGDFYEQDASGNFHRKKAPEEALIAVQEIREDKDGNQSIKMYNRMDALKLIIQLNGGLVQRHEHKVDVNHSTTGIDSLIEKCERLLAMKRIEGEVIDVVPEVAGTDNSLSREV